MKLKNVIIAAGIISVYIFLPAYRYYAIGSYIGYKILIEKPPKYRVVKKGSKLLESKI